MYSRVSVQYVLIFYELCVDVSYPIEMFSKQKNSICILISILLYSLCYIKFLSSNRIR